MTAQKENPNRLRELRKAARITQKELAAVVGCSQTTICHLESGRVPLDTKWMRTFARILNRAPADFLAHDDNPDRLAEDERRFVFVYRAASERERTALAKLLDAFAETGDDKIDG